MKKCLLLFALLTCWATSFTQSASYSFRLDYDLMDRLYSMQNGYNYDDLIQWQLNKRYNNNSNAIRLDYATTFFDTLLFFQGGSIQYVPVANSTLKLDSFDVSFKHVNVTGNFDSLRFTVYNMAQKTVTSYGTPNGNLNTPTLWDTLIRVNSSITPVTFISSFKRVYPNLQFAQGETFGIRVDYSGDSANHFLLDMGIRNECNGSCYGELSSAGNRSGYYLNYTPSPGSNLSGYYENAAPGGALFYDCNSSGNFTPGACEQFPIQNMNITAYVSAVVTYGVQVSAPVTSGCPGTSLTLKANAFGSTATPFTYAWSTTSGSLTSNSGNQTSLVLGNSNAVVTVTVTDANNQTTTATVTAQSKAINVAFSNSNPVTVNCGSTVGLSTVISGNTAGKHYSWSTGASGANTSNINVSAPGTYSVTVTNNSGCSATAAINTQYPGNLTNTVSFTAPSPVCAASSETFVNTSARQNGWSYLWTFGDGNIGFGQNGVNTYTTGGVYSVQLKQDSGGCQFSSPVQSVTVLPASNAACQQSGNFSVNLGPNQTVCIGQSVSVIAALSGQGTSPYTYAWQQTGSALNCTTCNNPGVVINQNSTYIVVVTDNNGLTARDTVVFTAVSCGGSNACGTSGSTICSPSGTLTQPGFSPASQNLPPFVNGQASNTVIQFRSFNNIVFGGQSVAVQSFKFDTISNLPTGLCWASNKASNAYANQEDGCIAFVGTPCAAPGQYKLYMVVTADIGVPIQTNADALGLKYFVRLKNSGDTDIPVDTLQTALFVAYGSAANCTIVNAPSVSLGINQQVCTGTTVTLQAGVNGGTPPYTYQWQSIGNQLSCNNCPSATATITQTSTFNVTVTDAANKTGIATVTYSIAPAGSVSISANGPTTFCQGGNVTLSASGYSSYAWSTGSTLSAINVTQSGTYSVTVVSGSGCTATGAISVNVVQPPAAPSIVGSTSITAGQPYTYAVTQASGVTYTWSVQGGAIQSGQGSNSVSVVWGSSGPYLVTLVVSVQGGCSATSTLTVINSSCSIGVNVNTVSSTPLCSGDTALLIAQVSGNAAYAWLNNGNVLPNQSNDTLPVTGNGSYQVQVTVGACTVLSSAVSLSFLPSPLPPVITGGNGSGNCTAQAVTLSVSGNYTGYQWNSGQSTATITVTNSGSYTVTVSNSNGCTSSSAPFLLNQSVAQQPSICIVSVDSLTGKNIVVWEKSNTSRVDSYFVYKEGVQFNVFNKIGAIGVNDFSTFTDLASTPQQQAERYKIAILDTCGIIGLQSDAHKTIHLTINQGLGNTWNLIWNHYEGFAYPSYIIYRGTNSGTLQQIATISSGNSSYTDLNPPAGVLYYQIEIVNPAGCTPTAKTDGYGSSRSNIAQTLPNGIVFNDAIGNVNVYPNPTEGNFVISVTSREAKQVDVRITDMLGQQLYNDKWLLTANENKRSYNLNLASGTYMVSIIDNGVKVTRSVSILK